VVARLQYAGFRKKKHLGNFLFSIPLRGGKYAITPRAAARQRRTAFYHEYTIKDHPE
jgi:hypothetical protein